ncbi:MAG: Rid family detoxifying hydrolase [Candidatus Binatia bacterium]|nr:Rid family detoxifying hydrolase [Candidatus Binatia bacterium]
MESAKAPAAVATEDAPAALGAYSQAVVAGGLIFCSGQIGLDPKTGEVVAGGVEAETERVLTNLEAVLAAAGADFGRVTKATIYLVDIADFAAVNAIYARRLGDARPARAAVGVASLPKGARVEIDAIAVAS